MLDLVILSGKKDQLAVLIDLPDVSGTVYPFRVFMIQRILTETLCCFLCIIVISKSQTASFDTDFSRDVRLCYQPGIIQQK